MKVYHGTTEIITNPDILHSKKYLDFGSGFYVTTFRQQAEKWALRKSLRKEVEAIVNIYEMQEDVRGLHVLTFEDEDEKWLDFVCACRSGNEVKENYDVIIGNVANDDVFKTVDMYFRGLWDKDRVLKELRYYKMNDQVCFSNQKAIKQVLTYQESYIVEQK